MEEHTNTIKRDKLYVGELVIPHEYQLKDNGEIVVYTYDNCRNILFSLDENEMASDVLYETPNYPVVNITNPTKYIDSDMVIKDAICLDELLKYFGYPEELTKEDINKIRDTFFTGSFGLDNAKLFGYHELNAEDITFYGSDKRMITNPVLLEGKRENFRRMQQMGYRMIEYVGNEILSPKYYSMLDKKANNSVYDYICGYVESIDSFAPTKKEGHKKVLKK